MSKNKKKINKKILRKSTDKLRLRIFKSNTNIYAQLINDQTSEIVLSHSSLKFKNGGNIAAAKELGFEFSNLLKKHNYTNFYFDRGLFIYKGRVKAFCDSIRESGFKL